jgi:hypothetical protein
MRYEDIVDLMGEYREAQRYWNGEEFWQTRELLTDGKRIYLRKTGECRLFPMTFRQVRRAIKYILLQAVKIKRYPYLAGEELAEEAT